MIFVALVHILHFPETFAEIGGNMGFYALLAALDSLGLR